MKTLTRAVLAGTAILQLAFFSASAQLLYSIDNNHIGSPINASDGTEPLDNWFGNEFTAVSGFNLLTRVDFACYTVTPGTTATLAIYQLGNPTIGPTRIYTQNFTPVPGGGSTVHWNPINLTTPVAVDPGQQFVVGIMIRNVIALPPNDVYPFVIDTSTTSTGSFWDRSAPNTFNLDDLSNSRLLSLALPPDGSGATPFIPGGRVMIRALGAPVPEPTTLALAGMGIVALLLSRRKQQ